ncbi:hypothetical protein SAMN05443667_10291 [Flavobacterium gillisiae]|uniref:Uncharacterized protein n=1 Tax=Flavobacterium gillisiae TaxID=150146 RepID=A0A1H3YQQ4_9FLAO|nr:hypothetical protein SAMN05443667_10291 [Flavobacterium gillisiae]
MPSPDSSENPLIRRGELKIEANSRIKLLIKQKNVNRNDILIWKKKSSL